MLGILNDKYHIMSLTITVFYVTVLCTTSVLWFFLITQMRNKLNRYNKIKTS